MNSKENPMTSASSHTTHRILVRLAIVLSLLGLAMLWPPVGRLNPQERTQERRTTQTTRDYRIHLSAYTFDPLSGEPDMTSDLRVQRPAGPAYYIIQLTNSPTREEKARLQREHGLRLTEYIPNFAYLEKITPQKLAEVSRDQLFRASVLYHPAFKISTTIGTLRFRTPERQALAARGLFLRAVLFSDANEQTITEALRGAGASDIKVLDDRKLGGSLRVLFVLPNRDALPAIARLEGVRWIEEVAEIIEDNGNTAGTIQSGAAGTTSIWNVGLHGEGQIIGMMDGGPLDINHCFFMDQPNNTPGLAHRKVLAIRNASGSAAGGHATFTSGNAAGDDINNPGTANRRGGAWASRLVSGNTADLGSSTLLNEFSAASSFGARIHSNSWHDDTGNPATYNQNAADVDSFTWNNEDNLVLGSAGNIGEEQGPPGTAKNAVCVSASQADPNEMNFGDGNAGPTADGRRKPDVVAPGCGINSATVATACGTGPRSACATSYATPHTAGASALIRQYFTEGWYPTGTRQSHQGFTPTGALIKAMLVNSTLDMTGIAGYPSMQEGWGIIRLNNAMFFPTSVRNLRVWDTRNQDGLNTGDARVHIVNVAANGQPLRITLVWSDPPGSAGTATPVVNDLNLVVTSPDGTQTFIGNDFAAGVSAANTGNAADALNNVEMVVVNNPAPGNWTVTVNGTAVNVGNPAQGYAVVATADMPEPPPTTGNQDTLVVRVKFADIAFEPPLANLQNTITDAVSYYNEVAYGQATILPDFRGPIALDNPKDYYYNPSRNLLIEMTEEVVAKLVAAEPNIFTKGTPNPADDVDRLILVSNDVNFTADWATTGPWPYDLPGGFTRPISVSIQSYSNPAARFTHGLGHQFNLVDLYAHPGVVFPRSYVDEWDNMAGLFTNVHPLTWEKERATWITSQGSSIQYIPRPATGTSYTGLNPIPLFKQESTATNRKAIAIGLTQGAATLANENVFYYVEARDNTSGFDTGLPSGGVLIYFVNELIPQGQGPAILLDKNPGTPTLADAAFTVGDSRAIPGTGITITVEAGTGGAAFNIRVAYTPPITDYNAFITAGDTIDGDFIPWFSPDIWVDSPKNGFNLGSGPPPADAIENPVAGMVNRIYARISNNGPGTAFDFDVRFRISEPYHTVGGEADFDQFVGIKHIPSLAQNGSAGSPTIVFVEWTPVDDGDPHSCVLVDLINLVGTDTNQNDNLAQENLQEVASITASPFHPVTYRYDLSNPYDEPALFYFRAIGAPPDWSVVLNPKKILLNPGERVEGMATVTPPENGKVCTSKYIQITSWTPRGDTIIPVGGAVVKVDLRKQTLLTLDAGIGQCDGRLTAAPSTVSAVKVRDSCSRITVSGCTNPKLPNQEIIVKFIDPDGNPVYHTVMTDANGCFEDFLVTVKPGNWKVEAEYEGGECQGPAISDPGTVFVPPGITQDPGRNKLWLSFHLGMNFPLGSFNKTHDPGPSMTLNAEYPFRDNLSAVGYLGFHYFHGERDNPNFYYTNLSLNLKQYFPVSSFRGYVEAGPGIYFPKTGPSKFGFNVGTGLSFNIQPKFKFEVGPDFHFVDPSGQKRVFVDARMGVAFRF
jgi:M6 family metalloprotease-like protein